MNELASSVLPLLKFEFISFTPTLNLSPLSTCISLIMGWLEAGGGGHGNDEMVYVVACGGLNPYSCCFTACLALHPSLLRISFLLNPHQHNLANYIPHYHIN